MVSLDFSKFNILVVGDLMLDVYYFGEVNRISPEAPVPVVKVNNQFQTLGGAGNVANNIVNLKSKVYLISAVGKDNNRQLLENILKEKKIKYSLLERNLPTITKIRILGGHQQIVRVDFEEVEPLKEKEIKFLEKKLNKVLNKTHSIIISDYGKGFVVPTLSQTIIKSAKKKNIPVIVDPKGDSWDKYKGATIVTPNIKELSELLKRKISNEDKEIEKYGELVRKKFNLDYLLVTRSEKGMTLISKNKITHIRTKAKEVYDVSGAGDTVVSVLATALASGMDIFSAVELANLAAGIVVGKLGTAPITLEELKLSIKGKSSQKIKKLEELLTDIKNLKLKGKKIIFTNGCFDILHRGHIEYLRKAKNLGDILIVGLNSDKSVKRLKGKSRPINKEDDRAEVLASLEFVDYVIIFDEDTPVNLIKAIEPDILVKGGDYKLNEIAGKDFAKETVIVDFKEGYSTTSIINRIKGSED